MGGKQHKGWRCPNAQVEERKFTRPEIFWDLESLNENSTISNFSRAPRLLILRDFRLKPLNKK
ncbi:Uncharacterized protein APZ42_016286 [Daphnia magna]|uniref:Uncharacterized protein n=1 Tax=Daphnia magna TaxID=35525 RepID=A0A165AID1_9CRUS|nr:Uncharacterized protein APZ42_016286 [Daphnia magna]